jgi:large subunit ribosomal protein L16
MLQPKRVKYRKVQKAKGNMTGNSQRGHQLSNGMFGIKSLEQNLLTSRQIDVAVVKPGRIMFEVGGVPAHIAKEALRLAAQKLPVKTKFVVARDFDNA